MLFIMPLPTMIFAFVGCVMDLITGSLDGGPEVGAIMGVIVGVIFGLLLLLASICSVAAAWRLSKSFLGV